MQRVPMLNDLKDGLRLYNFIEVLNQKADLCRGLFVNDIDDKGDAHYIISNLDPQMSEKGSVKHNKEIAILNYLQDFLNDIEDDSSGDDQRTVAKIMQWLTGQSHRHLLLSERQRFKITVCFNHSCQEDVPEHRICFPIVNACSQTVTFPTSHLTSYEEFKLNFLTAVKHDGGVHRI